MGPTEHFLPQVGHHEGPRADAYACEDLEVTQRPLPREEKRREEKREKTQRFARVRFFPMSRFPGYDPQ